MIGVGAFTLKRFTLCRDIGFWGTDLVDQEMNINRLLTEQWSSIQLKVGVVDIVIIHKEHKNGGNKSHDRLCNLSPRT